MTLVRRWRWWALLAAAALVAAYLFDSNGDWGLLAPAGRQLFGGHALDVYVDNKSLQAGPLGLTVIGLLTFLGPLAVPMAHLMGWLSAAGCLALLARDERERCGSLERVAVHPAIVVTLAGLPLIARVLSSGGSDMSSLVTASAMGAMLIWLVCGSSARWHPPRLLVAGLFALGPWAALASGETHVEDSLAILALVVGVVALRRGHPGLVALLVGVAIASKPWAVAGLPLLLDVTNVRRTLTRVLLAGAVPVLIWLPFVVHAPGTLAAAGYAFPLNTMSSWHLLGLHDTMTPSWLRSMQLVGISAVAGCAWRRGPAAVVAAGLAGRLLLDPNVFDYYAAPLVLALVVIDCLEDRPPIRTAWAVILVWLLPLCPLGATAIGWFRLVGLTLLVVGLIADRPRISILARSVLPASQSSSGLSDRAAAVKATTA